MKNKYVYLSFLVNIICIVIIVVFLVTKLLPPEVPLFYGNAAGENQLAKSYFLVLPPVIGALTSAVNMALHYFNSDLFVKKVLVATSLFVSILSMITVFKIILLVGFF